MAAALLISLLAAVIPTIIHTAIFAWADRFEREPRSLLLVALLWGAIPAIIASVILEMALGAPVDAADLDSLGKDLITGSFIAPLVEELCKGLAVLLIFWWKYDEFDGVLDGLLYGALVGFGFSMTEDLFYYIGAFDEGGMSNLSVVIFLRAFLFGLNHGFYTGLFGIGLGLARTSRSGFVRFVAPWVGLGLAIFAHSLHNFGATISQVNEAGLLLSLLLAIGSVFLLVIVVILAWQHEKRWIRQELLDEVGVLLSAAEYDQLINRWRRPRRRRNAEQADRYESLVELALRKHRLRQRGSETQPALAQAVETLRQTLYSTNVVS